MQKAVSLAATQTTLTHLHGKAVVPYHEVGREVFASLHHIYTLSSNNEIWLRRHRQGQKEISMRPAWTLYPYGNICMPSCL